MTYREQEEPTKLDINSVREADEKLQFACCQEAKSINCVCMYAFKCPKHGLTHIGTHD